MKRFDTPELAVPELDRLQIEGLVARAQLIRARHFARSWARLAAAFATLVRRSPFRHLARRPDGLTA